MTGSIPRTTGQAQGRTDQSTDRPNREWLAIGLAVAAVGWGANQFAPLLLMYRSELGASAATVQATYGLYAAGLIPGLLLGGPFSDRYGRRRIMAPALIVSVFASLLLMAGGASVGWLFIGRLVAGIASGAAFSSGSAWIKELSRASREQNSGARRATVAMTIGFAVGPLAAGLLAQWGPAPTIVAYVPHVAITLVSVPLVLRARETRSPSPETALWEPLRLPVATRRRFLSVVVPLAPWVFGASSIALAYLPGLVADRLGNSELVFSAVVTALTMLAGILIQPLARRVDHPNKPSLIATALGIVIAGLLLGAGAVATSQPLLIATAALVLGAGYGCCLVCGLSEVQAMARPDNLGRLTSIFQAIAYLGFAVPYLLAVIEQVVPTTGLLIFAAVVAGLTLVWTCYRATHGPRSIADSSAQPKAPETT